jgi:hypothetical protein
MLKLLTKSGFDVKRSTTVVACFPAQSCQPDCDSDCSPYCSPTDDGECRPDDGCFIEDPQCAPECQPNNFCSPD